MFGGKRQGMGALDGSKAGHFLTLTKVTEAAYTRGEQVQSAFREINHGGREVPVLIIIWASANSHLSPCAHRPLRLRTRLESLCLVLVDEQLTELNGKIGDGSRHRLLSFVLAQISSSCPPLSFPNLRLTLTSEPSFFILFSLISVPLGALA